MSRILVTGGAGFIASHISDALLERGNEVHVLDDLSGGKLENVPDAAVFHEMDIRSEETAELFESVGFDVLMHCAAQMDVRRSVADPSFDADVNLRGLLNLMESGRHNYLKKVVFASTGGAIYGDPDYVPQDEEHPLRPLSPYGIAKLSSEHYLEFYHHTYGIDFVSLRFGNVYGPRQNPHGEAGVVAIFTERLLVGAPVFINGDGNQTRDYVFVEDVVRANMLALDHPGSGIFNIGTAIETDVNELFRIIRDEIDPTYKERHADAKPGEQMRSVLSFEKARAELGWEPEVDVRDGLERTVHWFRERLSTS